MSIRIFLIIGTLFLLAATLLIQAHLLGWRYGSYTTLAECPWCEDERRDKDVVLVPLRSSMMRLISPSDPDFLADLLWMRAVYYFGQHALTDREYPYLFHLLDLITDLSPTWGYPYFFGAVILPIEAGAIDKGEYLIDKGIGQLPEDWELWFFKGFYLWKFHGDMLGAASALHRASMLPGSPAYLGRLSASLATKAGRKELALRFLEEALKNMHNEAQRKILEEKLEEVMAGG